MPVASRGLAVFTASRIAALLGTASVSALGVAPAIAADGAAPVASAAAGSPVEEVLVTGSLIHGAPAVGVPVTQLGAEQFEKLGVVILNDVLKEVPAVQISASTARQANGGANTSYGTPINIHGLTGLGPRELLLVDGMRYPPQNQDQSQNDVSLIPPLAVQQMQILADGASATYGSDAISGVINIILKRGYDGAQTQVRVGTARGKDGVDYKFSQLYGTTWDGGDITLTFETYHEAGLPARKRKFYTYDFTPYGYSDRTLVTSSTPGVVSFGTATNPNASSAPTPNFGHDCTNCYSVPQGSGWDFGSQAPAPTTTWTALLANKGVHNQFNPYELATITPPQWNNSAVITFDQELFRNVGPLERVELFVDGFYRNRRTKNTSAANSVAATKYFIATVPTINPYYPTGAPAGLRVSYSLVFDRAPHINSVSLGSRYATGFNLDLPFEWIGKVYMSVNHNQEKAWDVDLVNQNAVNAALGNTIASVPATGTVPGQAAYTKPASVPYLNLFCDSKVHKCNSDTTLDYISAFRHSFADWMQHEFTANFDGPLFELPAGELRAAVGASYYKDALNYFRELNNTTFSPAFIVPGRAPDGRRYYGIYGQLNAPLVSPEMGIPLVHSLNAELSWRYDKYIDCCSTKNPKVAVDWELFDGVRLHTAWGTSFRAPAFVEVSHFAHVIFSTINLAGGATTNSTSNQYCLTVGGTPVPGSAAEALNPTCSAALQFPGGEDVGSTLGVAHDVGLQPLDQLLSPETGQNLSFGIDFIPNDNMFGGWLTGLDAHVTYFFVKIRNRIDEGCSDPNDPQCRPYIHVEGDPDFIAIRDAALAHPANRVPTSIPASNIKVITDSTARNIGSERRDGIDFDIRYDWEMFNLGTFTARAAGTYYIKQTDDNGFGDISVSPYVGDDPYNGYGNSTLSRRTTRYQLGWTDGTFGANLYANYRSHRHPAPGGPPSGFVFAPGQVWQKLQPETYYFDLSLSYNTGASFANEYLHNINVTFVALNFLDRAPPLRFTTGGQDGSFAYDNSYDPIGRQISLTISKTW
jgi:iron complex outermembrane recepter protein